MASLNPKLLHYINFSTTTACFIGFTLSLYALLVEMNVENNPNYVAMCDINEHMSCTKAFSSPYGKGFGFLGSIFGKDSILNKPNSLHGMIFYTVYFFINMFNSKTSTNILIALALISNIASLYLAWILIFILKDFCVVCVATYFVNATLLFMALYKKNTLKSAAVQVDSQKKES